MADQWSFADDSAGKGWGFADEPSLGAKALNATGQFLRGLVPDTIKGMYNTAKAIVPDITGGEDAAKQAKGMIDSGDYLGAAKTLVSKAVESTPGGKLITGAVHNAIDEAGKARDAYQRGDMATAANHASRAIPVVGPMIGGLVDTGAGKAELRDAAGNVTQEATSPNPARMFGQIAALATGPKIAEALPGAVAKVGDIAQEGIPEALKADAEAQYGRVLAPATKGNKLRAEKVIPEMIDRGITGASLKSIKGKLEAGRQAAGDALDAAYESLPAGASVPLAPIVERMKRAAGDDFTVLDNQGKPAAPSSMAETGIGHVSDIADRLKKFATPDPTSGELMIPIETARNLRQFYDEVSKQGGRFEGRPISDQSMIAAHGVAGDALRAQIGETFPEVAKANADYQFYSDADRVVGDTMTRRTGQQNSLGRKLARAAGYTGGFLAGGVHGAIAGGAAMEAVDATLASPLWNTVSATLKNRLAKAVAGGTVGEISFYAKRVKAAQAQAAKNADLNNSLEDAIASGNRGAAEFYRAKIRRAEADDTIPTDVREGQPSQGSVRETQEGPAVQESPGGVPAATPQDTSVLIPGDAKELPARYALRELSDIQTSHHGVTFQPNPRYGLTNDRDYSVRDNQAKVMNGAAQFNPRLHVTDNPDATNGPIVINSRGDALGGNGRGMMLQRVYASNPEGAAAYRALLEQKAAQFGLDPEQVKGMKQPVLVREVSDEAVRGDQAQAAVTDLNKTGTAALRAPERAIADSRRVSQGTLDDIAGRLEAHGPDATLANVLEGKSGAEVLNKMIDDGVISPQERAGLASGDDLTPDGKTRISRLMVGRFFKDAAQIDRIPPAIKNKLDRLAAPLAKAEAAGEWNLTPHVQEALDLIEEARGHNKNLDMFLKQDALLSRNPYSAESVKIAKALQDVPTRKIVDAVRQYAQDAQFAQGGESLFGNAPTPKQSFREAFGQ